MKKNKQIFVVLCILSMSLVGCTTQGPQGIPGQNGQDGEQGDKGEDSDLYEKTYVITFDSQGGLMPEDFESEIEVAAFHSISDLPTPYLENYKFIGWFDGLSVNSGQFTTLTPVTRDMTIYARYESYPLHTIVFHTNGGNEIGQWSTIDGFVLTDLPTTGKEEHDFVGWYFDEELNEKVHLPYTVFTSLDLYAKWAINQYSVTYVTNSEYTLDKEYFDAGTTINVLSTPNKPYMEFVGWYFDEELTTPFTYGNNIHENLTVYAKWDYKYAHLTWHLNNGQPDVEYNEFQGNNINGLTPTRENCRFLGWYLDEELTIPAEFPMICDSEKEFYASWDSDYILINNADELASIYIMDGKYLLTDDIDMSEYADVNVRFGTEENHFTGIFDGGGHRIYNYNLTRGDDNNNFGFVNFNEGEIRNLKLEGTANYGSFPRDVTAGTLVGQNYGIIENCQVSVDLTLDWGNSSNGSYIYTCKLGGIVGNNNTNGTISNCLFDGSITFSSQNKGYGVNAYIAGIAGYNDSSISKCVNNSAISLNCIRNDYSRITHRVSGIANRGTITDSLNLSSFTGTVHHGGDIGFDATITNSFKLNSIKCAGTSSTQNKATAISLLVVNSASFYAEDLLLDSEIWQYENLDFDNGVYVSLK